MDAIRRKLELARVSRTALLRVLGLVAATTLAVVLAAPAAATGTSTTGSTPTPLASCGTTLPLTTPCTPAITAPTTAGGAWTLTLPGVGSLVFTVDPATNQIVSASVSGVETKFTASLSVDGEDGKVAATFTSTSTTAPTQVYTIAAKVQAPATVGGAPTVTAVVKSAEKEDDKDDDKNDKNKVGDEHRVGGGDHGADHGGQDRK